MVVGGNDVGEWWRVVVKVKVVMGGVDGWW